MVFDLVSEYPEGSVLDLDGEELSNITAGFIPHYNDTNVLNQHVTLNSTKFAYELSLGVNLMDLITLGLGFVEKVVIIYLICKLQTKKRVVKVLLSRIRSLEREVCRTEYVICQMEKSQNDSPPNSVAV